MKKLMFLVIFPILFGSMATVAQTPVPDPDTVSHPVQEGDPALRTLPPRLDYVEDLKRITPEELPEPVKESLESSAQTSEWKRATIYHDENKDEYVVEFTEAGKTTEHRFSKDGRPIVEQE